MFDKLRRSSALAFALGAATLASSETVGAPTNEAVNPQENSIQLLAQETIAEGMLARVDETVEFIGPYIESKRIQTPDGQERHIREINKEATKVPISVLMLNNQSFLERKPIDKEAARIALKKSIDEKYKDNPKALASLYKFFSFVEQDFFPAKDGDAPTVKIHDIDGQERDISVARLSIPEIAGLLADDAIKANLPEVATGLGLANKNDLYRFAYVNGWDRVEEGLRPSIQSFAHKTGIE